MFAWFNEIGPFWTFVTHSFSFKFSSFNTANTVAASKNNKIPALKVHQKHLSVFPDNGNVADIGLHWIFNFLIVDISLISQHCSSRLTGAFYDNEKSEKTFWLCDLFIFENRAFTGKLQQLTRIQSSKISKNCEREGLSVEDTQKGYLFSQKWYINARLGVGSQGGASPYKY